MRNPTRRLDKTQSHRSRQSKRTTPPTPSRNFRQKRRPLSFTTNPTDVLASQPYLLPLPEIPQSYHVTSNVSSINLTSPSQLCSTTADISSSSISRGLFSNTSLIPLKFRLINRRPLRKPFSFFSSSYHTPRRVLLRSTLSADIQLFSLQSPPQFDFGKNKSHSILPSIIRPLSRRLKYNLRKILRRCTISHQVILRNAHRFIQQLTEYNYSSFSSPTQTKYQTHSHKLHPSIRHISKYRRKYKHNQSTSSLNSFPFSILSTISPPISPINFHHHPFHKSLHHFSTTSKQPTFDHLIPPTPDVYGSHPTTSFLYTNHTIPNVPPPDLDFFEFNVAYTQNPHLSKQPSFFHISHPAYEFYKNVQTEPPHHLFHTQLQTLYKSGRTLALSQLFRSNRHDYLMCQESHWAFLFNALIVSNEEMEFLDHLTFLLAYRPVNWCADVRLLGMIIAGCFRFNAKGVLTAILTRHFHPHLDEKRYDAISVTMYQPEYITTRMLILAYQYLFNSEWTDSSHNFTITGPTASAQPFSTATKSSSATSSSSQSTTLQKNQRQNRHTFFWFQPLSQITKIQSYYNLSTASQDPYYNELFSQLPHTSGDRFDENSFNPNKVYPGLFKEPQQFTHVPFDTPLNLVISTQFDSLLQSLGSFWSGQYNSALSTVYHSNNPLVAESYAFSSKYVNITSQVILPLDRSTEPNPITELPIQTTMRSTDHTGTVHELMTAASKGVLNFQTLGESLNNITLPSNLYSFSEHFVQAFKLSHINPVHYNDQYESFVEYKPQSERDTETQLHQHNLEATNSQLNQNLSSSTPVSSPRIIATGPGFIFGHGGNYLSPKWLSMNGKEPNLHQSSLSFARLYGNNPFSEIALDPNESSSSVNTFKQDHATSTSNKTDPRNFLPATSNNEALHLYGTNSSHLSTPHSIINPEALKRSMQHLYSQKLIPKQTLVDYELPFSSLRLPITPVLRSFSNHLVDEHGTLISGSFAGYNPLFLSQKHAPSLQHTQRQQQQFVRKQIFSSLQSAHCVDLNQVVNTTSNTQFQPHTSTKFFNVDSSPQPRMIYEPHPDSPQHCLFEDIILDPISPSRSQHIIQQYKDNYSDGQLQVKDLHQFVAPPHSAIAISPHQDTLTSNPLRYNRLLTQDILRSHIMRLLTFGYNIDPEGLCFDPVNTNSSKISSLYTKEISDLLPPNSAPFFDGYVTFTKSSRDIHRVCSSLRQERFSSCIDSRTGKVDVMLLIEYKTRFFDHFKSSTKSSHNSPSQPEQSSSTIELTPDMPIDAVFRYLLDIVDPQQFRRQFYQDSHNITNDPTSAKIFFQGLDQDHSDGFHLPRYSLSPTIIATLYALGYSKENIVALFEATVLLNHVYNDRAGTAVSTFFPIIPLMPLAKRRSVNKTEYLGTLSDPEDDDDDDSADGYIEENLQPDQTLHRHNHPFWFEQSQNRDSFSNEHIIERITNPFSPFCFTPPFAVVLDEYQNDLTTPVDAHRDIGAIGQPNLDLIPKQYALQHHYQHEKVLEQRHQLQQQLFQTYQQLNPNLPLEFEKSIQSSHQQYEQSLSALKDLSRDIDKNWKARGNLQMVQRLTALHDRIRRLNENREVTPFDVYMKPVSSSKSHNYDQTEEDQAESKQDILPRRTKHLIFPRISPELYKESRKLTASCSPFVFSGDEKRNINDSPHLRHTPPDTKQIPFPLSSGLRDLYTQFFVSSLLNISNQSTPIPPQLSQYYYYLMKHMESVNLNTSLSPPLLTKFGLYKYPNQFAELTSDRAFVHKTGVAEFPEQILGPQSSSLTSSHHLSKRTKYSAAQQYLNELKTTYESTLIPNASETKRIEELRNEIKPIIHSLFLSIHNKFVEYTASVAYNSLIIPPENGPLSLNSHPLPRATTQPLSIPPHIFPDIYGNPIVSVTASSRSLTSSLPHSVFPYNMTWDNLSNDLPRLTSNRISHYPLLTPLILSLDSSILSSKTLETFTQSPYDQQPYQLHEILLTALTNPQTRLPHFPQIPSQHSWTPLQLALWFSVVDSGDTDLSRAKTFYNVFEPIAVSCQNDLLPTISRLQTKMNSSTNSLYQSHDSTISSPQLVSVLSDLSKRVLIPFDTFHEHADLLYYGQNQRPRTKVDQAVEQYNLLWDLYKDIYVKYEEDPKLHLSLHQPPQSDTQLTPSLTSISKLTASPKESTIHIFTSELLNNSQPLYQPSRFSKLLNPYHYTSLRETSKQFNDGSAERSLELTYADGPAIQTKHPKTIKSLSSLLDSNNNNASSSLLPTSGSRAGIAAWYALVLFHKSSSLNFPHSSELSQLIAITFARTKNPQLVQQFLESIDQSGHLSPQIARTALLLASSGTPRDESRLLKDIKLAFTLDESSTNPHHTTESEDILSKIGDYTDNPASLNHFSSHNKSNNHSTALPALTKFSSFTPPVAELIPSQKHFKSQDDNRFSQHSHYYNSQQLQIARLLQPDISVLSILHARQYMHLFSASREQGTLNNSLIIFNSFINRNLMELKYEIFRYLENRLFRHRLPSRSKQTWLRRTPQSERHNTELLNNCELLTKEMYITLFKHLSPTYSLPLYWTLSKTARNVKINRTFISQFLTLQTFQREHYLLHARHQLENNPSDGLAASVRFLEHPEFGSGLSDFATLSLNCNNTKDLQHFSVSHLECAYDRDITLIYQSHFPLIPLNTSLFASSSEFKSRLVIKELKQLRAEDTIYDNGSLLEEPRSNNSTVRPSQLIPTESVISTLLSTCLKFFHKTRPWYYIDMQRGHYNKTAPSVPLHALANLLKQDAQDATSTAGQSTEQLINTYPSQPHFVVNSWIFRKYMDINLEAHKQDQSLPYPNIYEHFQSIHDVIEHTRAYVQYEANLAGTKLNEQQETEQLSRYMAITPSERDFLLDLRSDSLRTLLYQTVAPVFQDSKFAPLLLPQDNSSDHHSTLSILKFFNSHVFKANQHIPLNLLQFYPLSLTRLVNCLLEFSQHYLDGVEYHPHYTLHHKNKCIYSPTVGQQLGFRLDHILSAVVEPEPQQSNTLELDLDDDIPHALPLVTSPVFTPHILLTARRLPNPLPATTNVDILYHSINQFTEILDITHIFSVLESLVNANEQLFQQQTSDFRSNRESFNRLLAESSQSKLYFLEKHGIISSEAIRAEVEIQLSKPVQYIRVSKASFFTLVRSFIQSGYTPYAIEMFFAIHDKLPTHLRRIVEIVHNQYHRSGLYSEHVNNCPDHNKNDYQRIIHSLHFDQELFDPTSIGQISVAFMTHIGPSLQHLNSHNNFLQRISPQQNSSNNSAISISTEQKYSAELEERELFSTLRLYINQSGRFSSRAAAAIVASFGSSGNFASMISWSRMLVFRQYSVVSEFAQLLSLETVLRSVLDNPHMILRRQLQFKHDLYQQTLTLLQNEVCNPALQRQQLVDSPPIDAIWQFMDNEFTPPSSLSASNTYNYAQQIQSFMSGLNAADHALLVNSLKAKIDQFDQQIDEIDQTDTAITELDLINLQNAIRATPIQRDLDYPLLNKDFTLDSVAQHNHASFFCDPKFSQHQQNDDEVTSPNPDINSIPTNIRLIQNQLINLTHPSFLYSLPALILNYNKIQSLLKHLGTNPTLRALIDHEYIIPKSLLLALHNFINSPRESSKPADSESKEQFVSNAKSNRKIKHAKQFQNQKDFEASPFYSLQLSPSDRVQFDRLKSFISISLDYNDVVNTRADSTASSSSENVSTPTHQNQTNTQYHSIAQRTMNRMGILSQQSDDMNQDNPITLEERIFEAVSTLVQFRSQWDQVQSTVFPWHTLAQSDTLCHPPNLNFVSHPLKQFLQINPRHKSGNLLNPDHCIELLTRYVFMTQQLSSSDFKVPYSHKDLDTSDLALSQTSRIPIKQVTKSSAIKAPEEEEIKPAIKFSEEVIKPFIQVSEKVIKPVIAGSDPKQVKAADTLEQAQVTQSHPKRQQFDPQHISSTRSTADMAKSMMKAQDIQKIIKPASFASAPPPRKISIESVTSKQKPYLPKTAAKSVPPSAPPKQLTLQNELPSTTSPTSELSLLKQIQNLPSNHHHAPPPSRPNKKIILPSKFDPMNSDRVRSQLERFHKESQIPSPKQNSSYPSTIPDSVTKM